MFKIEDTGIRKLEQELRKFKKNALPYATRNTLNRAAFAAQREARDLVQERFILRNRFTVQSIRVNKTNSLDVSRQQATVGSIADYMEEQEFGGGRRKRGQHGVPIPTSYAAGQAEGSRPRLRLPRKSHKLTQLRLSKNRRLANLGRGRRNAAIVRHAVQEGEKFVFLDLGRRKGIFKIVGSKRKPKIKMLYDLSRPNIVIPPRPWLQPSVKKVEPMIPDIYRKSLEFQIKRQQLFQGKAR